MRRSRPRVTSPPPLARTGRESRPGEPPAAALPRLNVILDADVAARAGWTLPDLAAACVAGGARWLQLRAKTISGGALLDLAIRIGDIAHAAGGMLVVNDRVDIARLAGADGVHVGQEDVSPADARAVLGPDLIVGFSTHTEPQVDAALAEPVSYIAVGPVFGTATKDTGYTSVGLDLVRYARAAIARAALPRDLVAIGGITLDRSAAVIEAGATAVAVIADLLATGDPEARVRAYLARLSE